jgi:hypothetical protein
VTVSATGRQSVHARLYSVGPSGLTPIDVGGKVTVAPGKASTVSGTAGRPIEVLADGPVAVSGDTSGVTGPGILTVPAVARSG